MQVASIGQVERDTGFVAGRRRSVGIWLLVVAILVLAMVSLGGLTRLTGSGLSMVEWQPLTVLPPLSDQAWATVFAKYQASPQYRLVNQGMDLDAFKGIFWLEYVHRLWGRLIGLVFLLPLLLFLATGRVGKADLPRLAGLFLLGGAQGLLGWLMVASGLVDRGEVSPLRLAAHLLAALAIYAALAWSAFDELSPPARRPRTSGGVRQALLGMLVLAVLTMAVGALVAGLHAGLVYNSFPLMNGALVPAEAFAMSPWWLNLLANHALVQFLHRLLAMTTWLASLALILALIPGRTRLGLPAGLVARLTLVPVAATLQAALGIATLLNQVPLPLAAAHQLGAVLVVTAILWALHGVSGAAPAVGRA